MSEEEITLVDCEEYLNQDYERQVTEEQKKLREQLARLRNGTLHSPGLASILSDLGKYHILEARADIEAFLISDDSEERRYALVALAVDFHLQEHLRTAHHFLESDPDDLCRITATTALGSLMEDTHDLPTLQLLAKVAHNQQETEGGTKRSIWSDAFDTGRL